ncbi:MAG TPA: hypothetical protein VGS80_13140 [Ktedonobacterales bacterium]|nr:hypothetical protein [Ktedonobacterales bacterium]
MSYDHPPHLIQLHEPGPDCPRFAALLPVLDDDDDTLDPVDAADARAHLAGCAYCRTQRAAYNLVDAGLRRHFGAAALATPYSMEELMSSILDDADTPDAPGSRPPSSATPTRPRHRRLFSGLGALAAVLILSLLATLVFITHPRVTSVSRQQPFAVPNGAALSLSGVSMVSSNEGWAVGNYTPPVNAAGTLTSHDKATAVLYHVLNGTWTRTNVAVNAPGETQLYAISMDSPTDGWAVGEKLVFANGQIATLLLHYDGHAWRQVSNSIQSGLGAVCMLSASEGWALSLIGTDAAIYHYDGISWTPQAVPAVSVGGQQYSLELANLSMISPGDGWAVGATILPSPAAGTSGSASPVPAGVILHFTGGTWRVQQIIPNAAINGIAMDAPGDGWAVGNDLTGQQTSNGSSPNSSAPSPPMLLLHFTAGHWVKVLVPHVDPQHLVGYFGSVFMSSPADGWISGDANTSTTSPDQVANSFVLLHYDGTSWTEVATPTIKGRAGYVIAGYEITSFSVPAPNDVWAVGSAVSTPEHFQIGPQGSGPISTNVPVIMRYHDGAWTVYAS